MTDVKLNICILSTILGNLESPPRLHRELIVELLVGEIMETHLCTYINVYTILWHCVK